MREYRRTLPAMEILLLLHEGTLENETSDNTWKGSTLPREGWSCKSMMENDTLARWPTSLALSE
jgi:hypothetical protein